MIFLKSYENVVPQFIFPTYYSYINISQIVIIYNQEFHTLSSRVLAKIVEKAYR